MSHKSWEYYILFDSAILTLAKRKYHYYDQRFMYKVVHHSIVMIFKKGWKSFDVHQK